MLSRIETRAVPIELFFIDTLYSASKLPSRMSDANSAVCFSELVSELSDRNIESNSVVCKA